MSALPEKPSSFSTASSTGQAVAVPAALAVDLVALHRAEPREHVLERPRLDVVGAGPAVGGGRALVEGPRLGARVARDRLLEDLPLVPEVQHLALEGGEVHLRGDGAVTVTVVLRLRRRGAPDEGTRSRLTPYPAVPPSLAGACSPTHFVGDPGGSTAAGSTDRGPTRADHVSSGDSGLIFSCCRATGLTPSPARSWPCSRVLVPSTPCGGPSVPELWESAGSARRVEGDRRAAYPRATTYDPSAYQHPIGAPPTMATASRKSLASRAGAAARKVVSRVRREHQGGHRRRSPPRRPLPRRPAKKASAKEQQGSRQEGSSEEGGGEEGPGEEGGREEGPRQEGRGEEGAPAKKAAGEEGRPGQEGRRRRRPRRPRRPPRRRLRRRRPLRPRRPRRRRRRPRSRRRRPPAKKAARRRRQPPRRRPAKKAPPRRRRREDHPEGHRPRRRQDGQTKRAAVPVEADGARGRGPLDQGRARRAYAASCPTTSSASPVSWSRSRATSPG